MNCKRFCYYSEQHNNFSPLYNCTQHYTVFISRSHRNYKLLLKAIEDQPSICFRVPCGGSPAVGEIWTRARDHWRGAPCRPCGQCEHRHGWHDLHVSRHVSAYHRRKHLASQHLIEQHALRDLGHTSLSCCVHLGARWFGDHLHGIYRWYV